MIKVSEIENKGDYVYDIQLDGTVVNALGMNVMSNTDGFNFQMPEEDKFRYTDEHPYIGKGLNRNTKVGETYTKVEGDVAEFNDLFMRVKNGLGIDEYANATINFSRKNYADFLENGKVKLVGNSIKSKKMPIYIEKFMNSAIDLLLHGRGREFLEEYYDYIEKIYNLNIPLREIASIGKIKTSIEAYKENCKTLTKSGSKKARQAWYELAIKEKLSVNMGDTIYYINNGTKKNSSDVQRVSHYYANDKETNEEIEITKILEKEYKKSSKEIPEVHDKKINKVDFATKYLNYKNVREEDEIIFNCVLLKNDIVEDDEEHYCDDTFEYNVAKYIEMFNKRIRPLLVCFSKDIRTKINDKGKEIDNILITNPKDRKHFTDEESKLVSGQPYALSDQDTYEQLMTIEDKEIKFWISVNKTPPYVKECGMDWEEIKKDYNNRMEILQKQEIKAEIEEYNKLIDDLTQSDVTSFIEDGVIPSNILKIVEEDNNSMDFVSKKWGVKIGSIYDIIDKTIEEVE